MNADLLYAAAKVIPNYQMLVNVVRLRVRQLCLGHRPLVLCAPGLSVADIALTEILDGKLTFEPTLEVKDDAPLPAVLPFPSPASSKKAA